ncbi:MAG: tRNA glutamyl-Q(34) synthetase GluQRS [Chthoniobacter sp.]|nr:tRNA glutamyl-Q(34) synthetase GluQRS [Chthoniobacter sp.]
MFSLAESPTYRGRLAPSPTGYLHLGHARTFWIAQERAAVAGGALILRSDDLDRTRCRAEFSAAMVEDLRWLGLRWSEGPDVGGPHAPYTQSERMPHYRAAFEKLRALGAIYTCHCSRQDVLRALGAPHAGDDEPVYPGTCRPAGGANDEWRMTNDEVNWRFRVPDGETISFTDGALGSHAEIVGRDFGDFLVWRKDGLPSYQLACVVDDAAMGITEVVRGADLLTSTCRQLLLYRTLELVAPVFYHCPLMTDVDGVRLAKRDAATSLRALRAAGATPDGLRARF